MDAFYIEFKVGLYLSEIWVRCIIVEIFDYVWEFGCIFMEILIMFGAYLVYISLKFGYMYFCEDIDYVWDIFDLYLSKIWLYVL